MKKHIIYFTLAASVVCIPMGKTQAAPKIVTAEPKDTVLAADLKWRDPDETIVYKKTPQGDLLLHVFKPEGWTPDAKLPVFVGIHGGGWNSGDAKAFYWQSMYLSHRGMVAISVEYRIANKHKTTPFECVMDGKSAIRYIRANADQLGIDPDRIAAGGGSAGGHVASAAYTLPNSPKFSDPAEIHPEVSPQPNALILFNPVVDTTKLGFGSKRAGENPEELSPLHNIPVNPVPVIIFNGDADKTTTIDRAREFVNIWDEQGGQAELVVYPGEPHSFFNKGKGDGSSFVDTVRRADAFLVSLGYLGKP